ncbi:uncharacterized protein TNCV_3270691 [Trichonephila clavipes]|nr:uncharacterized protein TNCV_3270691 [Trichonephila clavipes]
MWNPQKAGYLLRNILGSKVVKTNLKEDFHINYSVTSKWFTLIFCYFFIKGSSPEKFRQLFVKHQKNPETPWDDFYYEFQTYFEGWIAGLGITTFKQLKDLMITDQLKKKAPTEFKEHHLDEWNGIIYPVDLARKIEEYEDVRKTFQKKVTWSYSKDTMEKKWNNSTIIPRENVSMNNPMNTREHKNRKNHQDFEKEDAPSVLNADLMIIFVHNVLN